MNSLRYTPLFLLVLATTTYAQTADFATEVTPFGGYRFGGDFTVEGSDQELKVDDSASAGLIINFAHRDNTQWEILYSRQDTKASFVDAMSQPQSIDLESNVLQIGGTYLFEGDMLRPYIAGTLGGTHVRTRSPSSENDLFFSASLGAGVKILPTSRIGIRLEARAYGTFVSSSSTLFCSTGPDINVCAIRLSGNVLGQIETFAGLTIRF